MKPARFFLSLLGVALFLAIGTILVVSALAQASGTPLVDWGTRTGGVLGAILGAVLIIRAGLLWADNRKEKR